MGSWTTVGRIGWLAGALMAAGSAQAAPTQWNLDVDHTEVAFNVKHMMISTVRGAFHSSEMALQWDDKAPEKSTVEMSVKVDSIDTRVEKRDGHLKSPDFFDAAKYPTIAFKSTKIKKKGKGFDVTGDLTIRDVTKPVTLNVEGPVSPVADPFGLTRSAFVAKAKINRKDFGLTWNKALEKGGVLVGEDVSIEINGEIVRKDEAKAQAEAPPPAGTPAAKP